MKHFESDRCFIALILCVRVDIAASCCRERMFGTGRLLRPVNLSVVGMNQAFKVKRFGFRVLFKSHGVFKLLTAGGDFFFQVTSTFLPLYFFLGFSFCTDKMITVVLHDACYAVPSSQLTVSRCSVFTLLDRSPSAFVPLYSACQILS